MGSALSLEQLVVQSGLVSGSWEGGGGWAGFDWLVARHGVVAIASCPPQLPRVYWVHVSIEILIMCFQ